MGKKVAFDGVRETAREEWFIQGTEPALAPATVQDAAPLPPERPRIAYPHAKTIIALDPDIPTENNVVFFEAHGKGPFVWMLNNRKIGSSASFIRWKPQYGKYLLSLADGQGIVMDSVDFEVRGTPASLPGGQTD